MTNLDPPAPTAKRRAACDECRTKKLKCTGEQPSCSRCARENLNCVYSLQKQMGRPKKRQRTEEEGAGAALDVDRTMAAMDRARAQWRTNSINGGIGRSGLNESGSGGALDGAPIGGLGLEETTDTFETYAPTWLQSQEWNIPSDDIPGLTPDSSSNSPPTINLPPELKTHSARNHAPLPSTQRDPSTQLLLDPSLSDNTHLGCPPTALPDCACLSTIYLTLSNLQSMSTFAFPFALHPLREAMQTCASVLSCTQCPTRFITGLQNTQLAGTLLMSIAERFTKVLSSINAEASEGWDTKKFRLADLNTSTSHLHTGGLGCAAAFSIDLTPSEWRSMAKKVVKAEVHGPSDGNVCCAYLLGLTKQMRERHLGWIHGQKPVPDDWPTDANGVKMGGENMPIDDHVCLKYPRYAEKLVENYDWS